MASIYVDARKDENKNKSHSRRLDCNYKSTCVSIRLIAIFYVILGNLVFCLFV